jgi:hypothetical protein
MKIVIVLLVSLAGALCHCPSHFEPKIIEWQKTFASPRGKL